MSSRSSLNFNRSSVRWPFAHYFLFVRGLAALALLAVGLSGCTLPTSRALALPPRWQVPAVVQTATADDLRSGRRARRPCAAVVGAYRNIPSDWEDAGHRLEALPLSALLGLPSEDEGMAGPEGVRSSRRIREQHAAEHVNVRLADANGRSVEASVPRNASGTSATVNDGELIAGVRRVAQARCRSDRRSVAAEFVLGASHEGSARGRRVDGPLPPELLHIGLSRVSVTLLRQPSTGEDLIVRIDAQSRLQGLVPHGYSAVSRYWLRYARVSDDGEPRAGIATADVAATGEPVAQAESDAF